MVFWDVETWNGYPILLYSINLGICYNLKNIKTCDKITARIIKDMY